MLTAEKQLDVARIGALVLEDYFGRSEPSGLTSAERHKAYNMIKRRVWKASDTLEEFDNNVNRLKDYLKI